MGRALDNPWVLLALLLVLAVVAAVVVIVVLLNRTKAQPPAAAVPVPGYAPPPGGLPQPQGSYYYPGPMPAQHPGQTHSSNALILGIVGLFVLGIVLGPLAISQASKAERWGVQATAGKVLGWIDLIGGILWLLIIGSWMAAAIG